LEIVQRKLVGCSQFGWHHLGVVGHPRKAGLIYAGKEEAKL